MDISKFTLGEKLAFLPKSVFSKNKDYAKSTRAISKLKNVVLIDAGFIDIATVDPSETLELGGSTLPSSELMILAKCPTEADDNTGEPTAWGDTLVRLSISDEYLHAALAIRPNPKAEFNIIRVLRVNRDGEYIPIFPDKDVDSRIDEILSFEDMRRMVFGLASKVLKHKLVPTNPGVIYDKRLKNMSKKEKESYLEYKVVTKPIRIKGEDETRIPALDLLLDDGPTTNRMNSSRIEEAMKAGKTPVTSTKLKLMKKIFVGQQFGFNRIMTQEAKDISESILFVEINTKKVEFDTAQLINYERLPFPDFMFFVTLEFHDSDLDKDQQEVDAFLVRLKRLENGMVRQYVYYRSSTTNGDYTLFYVSDVDPYTGMHKVVGPVKNDSADLELLNGVMIRLIPVVKHALYTIITFEPTVKNDPSGSF